MTDLLKYAEEPAGMITRDSLMNFEEGAIIVYRDRYAVVKYVVKKDVTFCYVDSNVQETINYNHLHVVHLVLKKPLAIVKKWTEKDINFLRANIHLPNSNLARLLGRTEAGIANQKHLYNLTKKF